MLALGAKNDKTFHMKLPSRVILGFALLVRALSAELPPAASIKVPEGFKVELVRAGTVGEGSWACLAVDASGRLYLSSDKPVTGASCDRSSTWGGVWRVTTDANGAVTEWAKLPLPIGMCQGMLMLGDDVLFASGLGPDGQGIYRCWDANGDKTLDQWKLVRSIPEGAGVDGCHGITSGPGGIYFSMGKGVPLRSDVESTSPVRPHPEVDLLSSSATNEKVPSLPKCGHVLRCQPDGTKWEIYCMGLNLAADLDFSGWTLWPELVTLEADPTADIGLPGRRPANILKLNEGADYGFRATTRAVLPPLPVAFYERDMNRGIVVGKAAPTGVKYRRSWAYWPAYESAMFFGDWEGGRILTYTFYDLDRLRPIEKGSQLTEFAKAEGLHVTDIEFTPDGNLWFTVGGRGTASGLYRISALEPKPPRPHIISVNYNFDIDHDRMCKLTFPLASADREFVWTYFTNGDLGREMNLRSQWFVERFPFPKWGEDALLSLRATDKQPSGMLMSLVRCGDRRAAAEVLPRLLNSFSDSPQAALDAIKILTVAISRHGALQDEVRRRIVTSAFGLLKKSRPDEPQRKENPTLTYAQFRPALTQLLAFLQAPETVSIALGLLKDAHQRWVAAGKTAPNELQTGPQEEQILYARVLSSLPAEYFTAGNRAVFFHWFDTVAPELTGGANLQMELKSLRQQAFDRLPSEVKSTMLRESPVRVKP